MGDSGLQLDAAAIGRILFLPTWLQVARTEAQVAQAVERAFTGVPGVRSVAVSLDAEPSGSPPPWERIRLATARHVYGVIDLEADEPEVARAYLDAIRNAANLVALHLETERQAQQLKSVNERLEQQVEERTREALENEQRFRALFQLAPVGICQVGTDGCFVEVNDRLCEMLGYAREELVGRTTDEITHPDDLQIKRGFASRVYSGDIDAFSIDQRYLKRDGTVVWATSSASVLRGDEGRVQYGIGVIEDVTAKKLARDRLALETSLLGLMNRPVPFDEAVPELLDVLCAQGGFDSVGVCLIEPVSVGVERHGSPATCWTEGARAEDPVSGCPSRAEDPAGLRECEARLQSGRSARECFTEFGTFWTPELSKLTDEAGPVNPLAGDPAEPLVFESVAIVPIRHGDRILGRMHFACEQPQALTGERVKYLEGLSVVFAVFVERHLEEARRLALEAQLQHSQKLEAIGTLAAGIAHDFNNILTGVMAFAHLARADGEDTPGVAENIDGLLQGCERARDVVAQILAVSRQLGGERHAVALHALANEAARLMRSSLPSDIELDLATDSGCPPVLANAGQMHQVLMNLFTNAYQAVRDAVASGQTEGPHAIAVRVHQVLVGEPEAERMQGVRPGPHVELVVSDTGVGMDEPTRARVFEPYFTTRKVGEGTGLGLASAQGIVRAHGGWIGVTSSPDWGSVFRVLLPVQEGPADEDARRVEPMAAGGNDQQVLLVDDNRALATSVARALRRKGYRVQTCADGQEALAVFRRDPQAFDVVVTDQTMPRLSGSALVRELLAVRPDLPIVLVSGFGDRVGKSMAEGGACRFLAKPFGPDELAAILRELLRRSD